MDAGTTTHLQRQIDRLKTGDASAREELIQRTADRMLHLTRHIMRDFKRVRQYEDSMDVMQNAYVRLLRRLEKIAPETVGEFFRIAAREIRCTLLDLARHHFGPQGAGMHEQQAPLEGPAIQGDSAPAAREHSDRRHEPANLADWTEFHRLVDELPEDERAVVDLLWYHGATQEEAAELLGVSVPTVKRRWLAARMQLKEAVPNPSG